MTDPMLPRDEHERLVEDLTPAIADATRERPPIWRQPWFWCVLLGAVLGLVAYVSLLAKASNSADDAAAARSDAATANRVAGALASQVRQLGGVPVATPSPVPGPTGARGATGATGATGRAGPGPTKAQITTAVNAYCDVHNGCTGTPSKAQVHAAVVAFCAAGGCRGASGRTGIPGAAGASGASGSPGPGPTSDQISTAITAYCGSHDDCAGPPGPAGPKGEPGASGASGDAGVGIASLDCDGLGLVGASITVHYTDGRTATVTCNATPSGAPS